MKPYRILSVARLCPGLFRPSSYRDPRVVDALGFGYWRRDWSLDGFHAVEMVQTPISTPTRPESVRSGKTGGRLYLTTTLPLALQSGVLILRIAADSLM